MSSKLRTVYSIASKLGMVIARLAQLLLFILVLILFYMSLIDPPADINSLQQLGGLLMAMFLIALMVGVEIIFTGMKNVASYFSSEDND